MPRYGFRRRRRPSFKGKNAVIHVPATIAGTVPANSDTLIVIQSPSIDAGGSASSNIEAQDKDRTVNVGHHVGQINVDLTIRNTTVDGAIETCIMRVERNDSTPAIGTHPVPSVTDILNQGMQQACRLQNPGRVWNFSVKPYSIEMTQVMKLKVRPSKFRSSKVKAGDYIILLIHNRGGAVFTYDFQCRYKEYE